MTIPAERSGSEILRYFFALVVVLGVAGLLLTTSIYSVQQAERAHRERLTDLHLRVAFLTGEAIGYLEKLHEASEMNPLGNVRAVDVANARRRDRAVQVSVLSLGQALRSIADLHDGRHADVELFDATIERANRQYDRLRDAALNRSPQQHDRILREALALRFTLYQLDRLHAIAAAATLDEVARSGASKTRRTALAIVAVLLVSGLLIWRLLVMVRARLREQERTESLVREQERQLRHSSKMEALGTLVGGVAHDFNNILTAILGNVEWLQSETLPTDPHRETLDEIRKAGERAATLTSQLLAFGRQQAVNTRVVDANLLLDGIAPMLRRLIREDVTFSMKCDAAAPCNIEIDPVQMEQAIVNLAVNARDAMETGGTLTIETSIERLASVHPEDATLGPGEYVRIRVEDSGCGMTDEEIARAFDPFFTTKEPGKGTGLGLSTVHGIVNKGSGRVLLRSEVGRGTCIDIYLPRSRRTADRAGSDSRETPIPRGSETVLLAEDDPHIRRLASDALRRAGYSVLVASDGREALEISSRLSGRLDLIVSDVVMPGLRGPEMVERARDGHPDAAVLFISGYNEDEAFGRGGTTGAPVLLKPFTMAEFLSAVRERLDGARRPASPSVGVHRARTPA